MTQCGFLFGNQRGVGLSKPRKRQHRFYRHSAMQVPISEVPRALNSNNGLEMMPDSFQQAYLKKTDIKTPLIWASVHLWAQFPRFYQALLVLLLYPDRASVYADLSPSPFVSICLTLRNATIYSIHRLLAATVPTTNFLWIR